MEKTLKQKKFLLSDFGELWKGEKVTSSNPNCFEDRITWCQPRIHSYKVAVKHISSFFFFFFFEKIGWWEVGNREFREKDENSSLSRYAYRNSDISHGQLSHCGSTYLFLSQILKRNNQLVFILKLIHNELTECISGMVLWKLMEWGEERVAVNSNMSRKSHHVFNIQPRQKKKRKKEIKKLQLKRKKN